MRWLSGHQRVAGRDQRTRRLLAAALLVALAPLATRPCRAEDSDQVRYYLSLRYGEISSGLTRAHDVAGLSVGANLNRYFGLELGLDTFDLKVEDASEFEVLAFIPQFRLRYPLFHDRLVPYFFAGVGAAVTQANDGREPVVWTSGKTGSQPMGSVGGGLEYFVADNIAVGLEGKYLMSGYVPYSLDGGATVKHLDLNEGFMAVALRVFYPQLHPDEMAESAAHATARFYLDVRTGTALLINRDPFPGVRATPEQPIFNSNLTPLFGATFGATIGRYAAVELSIENYELKLGVIDVGGIGEYAVFPFLVQPRLRYPLLDGRLEPYVLGGVGAEFAELNDRGAVSNANVIKAKNISVIGAFGTGIEYAVLSNVSIGCEAKYNISRGHTFQFNDGPVEYGNFDAFFLSVGVRIFLYDL